MQLPFGIRTGAERRAATCLVQFPDACGAALSGPRLGGL